MKRSTIIIVLSFISWTGVFGVGCTTVETVEPFPEDFVGVGIEIEQRDGELIIIRTLPDGAAAEAGVLANDSLIEVNNVQLDPDNLGDAVMRLRGKADTQVTMTVLRDNKRLILVLKRRSMVKNDTGYSGEEEAPSGLDENGDDSAQTAPKEIVSQKEKTKKRLRKKSKKKKRTKKRRKKRRKKP
ncbi:PDZ domain-containing protein [Myxococcota bacterium]|nr:PDZ domain-containing protein [Myxococcota bacterium]